MSVKKSIAISILLSALGLLALWLSARWLGDYDLQSINGPKAYIIPLAMTAVLYLFLRRHVDLGFFGRPLRAFKFAFYVPIAGLLSFSISYILTTPNQEPNVNSALFLLASCLLTGLFEEWLCRGMIQGLLSQSMQRAGRSDLRAVALASAIFALMHFANLIDKPYFVIGTVAQVVYTFALGFMLGVAYLKSRSLLAVMLLHGLFNFLGSAIDLFVKSSAGGAESDLSLISLAIQWAIVLPGLFLTWLLYKKDAVKATPKLSGQQALTA